MTDKMLKQPTIETLDIDAAKLVLSMKKTKSESINFSQKDQNRHNRPPDLITRMQAPALKLTALMNPRTTILKIEEIESASTDSKAGSASVTLNRKSQDDINNDLDDFKNPGNQSFSSRLHHYEQQPAGL